MLANYTSNWLGQEGISLIWIKARRTGIATRLLFYFVKWKNIFSNESEYIGRGAEVWEGKERSRTWERKEQEKEKESEK